MLNEHSNILQIVKSILNGKTQEFILHVKQCAESEMNPSTTLAAIPIHHYLSLQRDEHLNQTKNNRQRARIDVIRKKKENYCFVFL